MPAVVGAVETPDLYRCAVSIIGLMNLPRLISDSRDYIGGSAWTRHVGLTGEKAASVSPCRGNPYPDRESCPAIAVLRLAGRYRE